MTYIGKVRNGTVVLPPAAKLTNGMKVRVEPLEEHSESDEFTRKLLKLSRKVKGLPADLAENHDHYLYGTPKR